MTALSEIEKIKILTGEQNEQLIEILLEDAEAFVKAYTGRTQITTGLEKQSGTWL